MNHVQRQGKARLVSARAFELLATIYESPAAVLDEYIENGADAGATHICVLVARGSLVVVDDGHGMVPDLLPDDRTLLEEFFKQAEQGQAPTNFDIREMISPTSRKSLAWMTESIAFSPKIPSKDDKVRGIRGIGAQAFRQIAEKAIWRTRPAPELAREVYWGEGRKGEIPTLVFEPPSAEQLRRHDVSYEITESDPLVDLHGHKLVSGTRVEISQIKAGLENALRPGVLADHFRSRFGEDIRTGRFSLVVIDRVTEEARRVPGGQREIHVEPIHYRGILVLQRTCYLKGGKGEFGVEFYYDPDGRGFKPMLRRKGSDIRPLTELPEFDRQPFNSGRMSGYADFPDLPEMEAPWSTDKRTPLNSPARNQWEKAIVELAGDINAAAAAIEERSRERMLRDITADLATATVEAMREVPVYQDLVLGGPTTRQRGKGGTKKSPLADRVVATVFNEHNRGVAGITLELLRAGQLLARSETGRSGIVSLGRFENGRYIARLIVPDGMAPAGPTDYTFNISANQPGMRLVFRLQTKEPVPEETRMPRLDIWLHAWGQVDEMYSTRRLQHGMLEINSEAPDIRVALDAKDYDLLSALVAQCAAAAVTEYGLKGDPAFLFAHATQLFAKVYQRARGHRAEWKKRKGTPKR